MVAPTRTLPSPRMGAESPTSAEPRPPRTPSLDARTRELVELDAIADRWAEGAQGRGSQSPAGPPPAEIVAQTPKDPRTPERVASRLVYRRDPR